jgi:antibiotic biosynthesis monooxygenase (ABM) superfamily enzyme
MNTFFKANLIVLYVLAAAGMIIILPWGIGPYLQRISLALFAIHMLETIAMFKHVKSYEGPIAKSVVLSLLYGLLHWLPLMRANQRKLQA